MITKTFSGKIFAFLIALQLVFVPAMALAHAEPNGGTPGNIIPTCNQEVNNQGQFEHPCDFEHFLQLVRNIIRFVVLYLTLPAIAISVAWAGVIMVTSGGDTGKLKSARTIFFNVVIGIIAMIGAWFVVEAIYSGLGYAGFLEF